MKIQSAKIFVAVVFAAILILSISKANAQLGQSAGALVFVEVPRGGQETLSYGLVNRAAQPMEVEVEIVGNLSAIAVPDRKVFIIPANSDTALAIIVTMPANATAGERYAGQIFVKEVRDTSAVAGSGASLGIFVWVVKNAGATAGEEIVNPPKTPPVPKTPNTNYLLVAGLAITGAAFLFIRVRGRKK